MNRTDPDLTAVRDLPPGLAEPTDASVTRTWYLLSARQTAAQGGSRRPLLRLLVPIAAAALVGVVTISAINWTSGGGADFAAPQIDLISASHQPLPTEHATHEPSLTRTTPEAVAALEALAHTAEQSTAVVTLSPGQLIHVDTAGWAARLSGGSGSVTYQPRSVWLDPAGMITLKLLAGDRDLDAGSRSNAEAERAQERQLLAEHGPSLAQPTPQWLASLPTDPAQLLARLRAETEVGKAWTVDHQLWDNLSQFYSECDILLSPQLRAALLRAFTGMDGLTAGEVYLDGTRLIAIRQTDQDTGYEILFDPVTAWAVGRRTVVGPGTVALTAPDSGPAFDPLVNYHATWTQTIVPDTDSH
ncbi:hypothetical protein Cs7R123_68170 [Catellatospora sp. TT07R-123]|uniref:hypothetical protein n=1 Tax=Catellatospora sp. TT07R-123 TaxID=2733863 RepID=UPI001B12FF85|nr:hypothetical protein [Catellatospora sp. TT07R-123]GHJ49475.1 hypothetical protein Cs7R123_68170 [Catellatospora sp. TT07R-123]